MLRPFFIVSFILTVLLTCLTVSAEPPAEKQDQKTVVITSDTLTADNKNSTAVFEGAVVAKTEDVTIHSDKMTVYYDNAEGDIQKIHASGNVRVHSEARAIFSEEAVYFDDEGKIEFSGNPKAVEGENLITGTKIIFYVDEDRAVVEGSKVFLQNKKTVK